MRITLSESGRLHGPAQLTVSLVLLKHVLGASTFWDFVARCEYGEGFNEYVPGVNT
jgi:hypothetical protein